MKRYKVKRREVPNFCPNCGSKHLYHAGLEATLPYIEDAVSCDDCGFTYAERWKWVKWIPTGDYSELS